MESIAYQRFDCRFSGNKIICKYLRIIQIDKSIMKKLDDDDISTILKYCTYALEWY